MFLKFFLNERISTNHLKTEAKTKKLFQIKKTKSLLTIKDKFYKKLSKFMLDHKNLIFIMEVFVNIFLLSFFDFEYNIFSFITIFYLTTSLLIKKYFLRFGILFYILFPIIILMNMEIYYYAGNHQTSQGYLKLYQIRSNNV